MRPEELAAVDAVIHALDGRPVADDAVREERQNSYLKRLFQRREPLARFAGTVVTTTNEAEFRAHIKRIQNDAIYLAGVFREAISLYYSTGQPNRALPRRATLHSPAQGQRLHPRSGTHSPHRLQVAGHPPCGVVRTPPRRRQQETAQVSLTIENVARERPAQLKFIGLASPHGVIAPASERDRGASVRVGGFRYEEGRTNFVR